MACVHSTEFIGTASSGGRTRARPAQGDFAFMRFGVSIFRAGLSASIFAVPVHAFAAEGAAVTEEASADGGGSDAGDRFGDIVVTAERRETSLQKTPIAISAVGGDALQAQRLQVLRDLATEVPSLVTPGMHANMQSVYIRGIGTSDPGVYPAVGLYIDDVYIPRTFGNGIFDLPDIQRVEVLRGPQGTLYGLNTSAGAIKFVSRDPGNETIGHVDIGYGSYDAFDGHAYISGPVVSDRLSASFAYTHRRRDGHIYNVTLGKYVDAVKSDQFRAKLRWTPTGAGGLDVILSVDGTRERSDNANYIPVGYPHLCHRNMVGHIFPYCDRGLSLPVAADAPTGFRHVGVRKRVGHFRRRHQRACRQAHHHSDPPALWIPEHHDRQQHRLCCFPRNMCRVQAGMADPGILCGGLARRFRPVASVQRPRNDRLCRRLQQSDERRDQFAQRGPAVFGDAGNLVRGRAARALDERAWR